MRKYLIGFVLCLSVSFLSGCITTLNKTDICPVGKNKGKLVAALIPLKEIVEHENTSTGDDYEIYIIDPDGSGQQRLTNNLFHDVMPTWVPDGKKIVYFRIEPLSKEKYDTFLCLYDLESGESDELKLSIPITDFYFSPFFISDTELILGYGSKEKVIKISILNLSEVVQTKMVGLPMTVGNGYLSCMKDTDNGMFLCLWDEKENLIFEKKDAVSFPNGLVDKTLFYVSLKKSKGNKDSFQVRSFALDSKKDELIYQIGQNSGDITGLSVSYDAKYFAMFLPKAGGVLVYNIDEKKVESRFTFPEKIDDDPYPIWSLDNKTIYFWIDAELYHMNPQGELIKKIDMSDKFKRENQGSL